MYPSVNKLLEGVEERVRVFWEEQGPTPPGAHQGPPGEEVVESGESLTGVEFQKVVED